MSFPPAGVDRPLHLALLPAAGMGHLIPFLRLASSLVHHHNCRVTLITTRPTITHSESQLISNFISSCPHSKVNQLTLFLDSPAATSGGDPFFLRFEAIRRSAHLLRPVLSSIDPPPSALISDPFLISPVIPVAQSLNLPNYLLYTSSARMFSVFTCFSECGSSGRFLEVPGMGPIARSSVPPPLLDPVENLFGKTLKEDGPNVKKLNGVLINTFEGLEGEALDALRGGKVTKSLPPIFALGPFVPCEFEKGELEGGAPLMKWLDDEPPDSVVFVSFGSRTTMDRAQMRELGDGLVSSGFKFIWVVKDKKVDKEEKDGLEEVLGHELLERVKDKGMVVKSWVDQVEILRHKAVGGFVSHCGWNSVMEAAAHGVRVLAWPQHGDQKMNAEVVEMSGLGMWVETWGWPGEVLVKGEEIGEKVREMMGSEEMKMKATHVGDKARKAIEHGGNFQNMLRAFMEVSTTIDNKT